MGYQQKKGKCIECGNITARTIIKRCRSCGNKNERHSHWKGDKVSYVALHTWIRKNKPKHEICNFCGVKTDKLEIANISGNYKREISDYRYLCRRCHMESDGRLKNLTHNHKSKEGEDGNRKNAT